MAHVWNGAVYFMCFFVAKDQRNEIHFFVGDKKKVINS